MIGNDFFIPIVFKDTLKTGLSWRNILITICVGCAWIVNTYFLFEKVKQAFNGLFKVISIQMYINHCILMYFYILRLCWIELLKEFDCIKTKIKCYIKMC